MKTGMDKQTGLLPLYRNDFVPGFRPPNSHTGLWYEKFCNVWSQQDGAWTLGTDKSRWIESVIGETGDQAGIRELVERMKSMVLRGSGMLLYTKTEGRFVTGLGRSHPVENGFAWHPTLGTAYLPGSSVKGLVRSWAEQWEDSVKPEDVKRIFGCQDQPSTGVGSVIFYDAIPIKQIKLEADVMTPHYGPYYQEGKAPVDWHAPVPIPFLTVAADQPFLFSLAPRRPGEHEKDVKTAMCWLKEALRWMGAGAKTAVGYGRFMVDENKQNEWKQALADQKREQEKQAKLARLARMTPVEREMEEDGYQQDPNRFMELLAKKWLVRMEEENTPPADRMEIAQRLAEWYQTHRSNHWKKPNLKNEEKIRRIRAVLNGKS